VVQLPVNVGVVLLVMLSVFDVPVSVAAVISGAVAGAVGAVVSTVKAKPVLAAETLPAGSVAVTVAVKLPSLTGDVSVIL
jgi:hypothetical protein